jgi:TP901-1 family phage major tail protein
MGNGSSIVAQPGRSFLLEIDLTGVSPTVYTSVAGMRLTDVTLNGSPVDITNKGSGGWQEMLPGAGVRSANLSASGIMDTNTLAPMQKLMQSALQGGTFVDACIVSGSGDKLFGTWAVDTFKRTGNYNEAETFELTLKSHGPVIYSQR